MSRPIDEKIVRMSLDNANFKKEVEATLNSFKAINEATRESSNLDISNMAKGIASINKKFSASGVIVASVLKNMTDTALSMGKSTYHAIVDPIVEGGKKRALSIEQAKFQFEGLGMDVEATMASALEAVKGTAYGLDEAAVVAGQFGASGMRAGDEMTASLRGIAGVAAMTGSSYSDVGNIFTKVAGNGRLMGDDLLRLSARGVNAAAVLAKEFDTTEEAVRKMVTAGEISFDMFSQAMSNAFGEHATKANETYTGALMNMKAALGRIGAEVQANKFEQLRRVIVETIPKIDDMASAIQPVIDAVNDLAAQIADWLIVAIRKIDFTKFIELGGIGNIVQGFWNIVSAGKRILSAISKAFLRMFPDITVENLIKLTQGFENLTSKMTMGTSTYNKVITIFEGIFSVFSTVWEIVKVLAQALFGMIPPRFGGNALDVAVAIAEMAISFNEAVKEGNWLTDTIFWLGDKLGWLLGHLQDVVVWVVNFAKNIKDHLGSAIEWIGDKLAPVAKWFKEAFGGISGEDILAGGFVSGIAILAFKLGGFMDKIVAAFSGFTDKVTAPFTELGEAIKTFQKNVKYKSLAMIAGSILGLAIALKIMEGIKAKDIAKGIAGLGTAFAGLIVAMKVMDKFDIDMSMRTATSLIGLSIAVGLMGIALKKISDLNPKEMITGLSGLLGIVAVLSAGMIAMSKLGGKMKVSSIGLVALATAIVILSSAVKTLSKIDVTGLAAGVGTIGVLLLELSIFMKLTKNSQINLRTGIALMGIATSIQIMVSAIKKIAGIDTPNIVKGLLTISAILAAIVAFSKVVGSGGQLLLASVGLIAVSVGMNLLVRPIRTLGEMPWEELIRGLTGMTGALLAITLASVAASAGIVGALAITLVAGAMMLLIIPLKAMSKMSWGALIKGITGLALALTAVSLTGALLSPLAPLLLITSAAFLVFAAAVAVLGGGIALFGVGLTALASLTAVSIASIVSALGLLLKGLTGLIPAAVQFVVDLTVALVDGLLSISGKLISAIHELTLQMLNAWKDNIDEYIEVGAEIVLSIMNGIETYGPELIEAGYSMIVSLIEGMANTLETQGDRMVEAMSRLMKAVLLVVIKAGAQMVVDLLGWIPGVEEAMGKIVDSAESRLGNFEPDKIMSNKMSETGMAITESGKVVPLATERVGTLGMSVMERLDYMKTGQFLMDETESGITSKGAAVGQAAEGVSNQGILGLLKPDWASPGASSGDIYGDALSGKAPKAETSGSILGNAAHGALEKIKGFFLPTASASGADYSSGIAGTSGLASASGTLIGNSANSAAGGIAFTPTGSNKGGEFSSGVSSTSGAASSSGSLIGNAARTGAEGISLSSAGSSRGGTFVTGVSSKHGAASTSGSGLSSSAKKGAEGTSLYTVGSNMGSGFVKGIGSWIKSAASKASELAGGAMAAIKKRTKQRSPSKETFWMGEYFGEGWINGIASKVKQSSKTAGDMAEETMKALGNSLDMVPEDFEIRVNLVVDDSQLDKIRQETIDMVRPSIGQTYGMASYVQPENSQNGNITNITEDHSVENYTYEVNITTNSTHTRDDVRKLADRIQTELKNAKDRDKMGRGEAVIF